LLQKSNRFAKDIDDVAETHLADGELLDVAVNMEEFMRLRGRIPVMSKRDGQYFIPE
jgi:hypothetical protein